MTMNMLRTVITRMNQTQLATQFLRTPRSILNGSGSRSCSLSSALGHKPRKCVFLRLHVSVSQVFTQVDVLVFLPPYGENSVCPSQVSGFRAPVKIDLGKREAGRFAGALFSEDHLSARGEGKSELQLYIKPLLRNKLSSMHSFNGKTELDQYFVTSRPKKLRQTSRRRTLQLRLFLFSQPGTYQIGLIFPSAS